MITLIMGNEPYRVKCELDRIKKEYGSLGVSEHEGLSMAVYEDCMQVSLFSQKKAVIVKCAGVPDTEGFLQYLKHPSAYTDLYLINDGMDKRSSVYKSCMNKSHGVIVKKLDKVSKDSFIKLCEGMIKKKGRLVQRCTLERLYEYTGYAESDESNLFEISIVIKQMCCQTETGSEIAPELVEVFATPCQNAVVWELSDALFSNDSQRLLSLGERLLTAGESPIAMLSALIRQFRLAYKMKVIGGTGASLSNALGVQTYRLQKVCMYQEGVICRVLHTLQNRVNDIKNGYDAVAVFRLALRETELMLCSKV